MRDVTSKEIVTIEPVAVRVKTAAKMLDAGVSKVYQLVKEGKLEPVRFDADMRIRVTSIKKLIGE